jgi:hypothetical protein
MSDENDALNLTYDFWLSHEEVILMPRQVSNASSQNPFRRSYLPGHE